MSLAPATRTEILRQKDRYPQARSAVLPSLWALQHEQGYITVEGMREVAELLGLAPSEVQAVSTFYSMYFATPPGKHTVLLCKNVSCALRGSDEIEDHLENVLGCPSGGTSADGAFTWEATVECLGACGGAPAMQVDHHFHENLTPGVVDKVLADYRSKPAPHAHHAVSEPVAAPAHGGEVTGAATVVKDPSAPASGDAPAEKPKATPKAPKAKSTRSKRPRPNADDL